MEQRELQTAVARYSYLRGWFFIPGGALAVLAALGNWEVGPLRHPWAFALVAGLIVALCLPIARFYNNNYGRVSASPRQQARAGAATLAGVAVMIGGSLLMRSNASWSLDLPVNATAVSFAFVMLIAYGVGVGLKTYHLIICGTLLVAGALPVWNGADPSNIGLVMAGVAMALSGVFDHRLFVRTFGPPKGMDVGESDA